MAKNHSYDLEETWFDLEDYNSFGKVPRDEVLSIVTGRPVKISLTVVVPEELISGKPPKFEIERAAPIRRQVEAINTMLVETMEGVALARRADNAGAEKAYEEAKKKLDALNEYIKRSMKHLRPMIREAVAKALGGTAKADDLQTIGSVNFREYEIRPGTFANEVEVEPPLLDLDKAFKCRKEQACGIAWNGRSAVISVRRRKDFKAEELKELRDHLPNNKSVGATMLTCTFFLESSSRIVLGYRQKDEAMLPKPAVVIKAIKKQSQRVVTSVVYTVRTDKEEDKKSKKRKDDKDGEDNKAEKKDAGKEKGERGSSNKGASKKNK